MISCAICDRALDTSREYLTVTDYSVTKETFSLYKCSKCSVLKTRFSNFEELERYYETSDYASHGLNMMNPVHHAYRIARYFTTRGKIKLLQDPTGISRVLDFGCGTGHFLNALQKKHFIITGIEPNKKARDLANQITGQRIFKDLSETSGTFHAITLWHVLEHTSNPDKTIKDLIHRLEPNGRLFVALPNYHSYDTKHYKDFWAGFDTPRHLWHFCPDSVRTLAEKNKLQIEKIVPMKLDAYYVSLLSEKYKSKNRLTLRALGRAIQIGWRSNRDAMKTGNYSSLIYIMKK